jgi:hypothetical protein
VSSRRPLKRTGRSAIERSLECPKLATNLRSARLPFRILQFNFAYNIGMVALINNSASLSPSPLRVRAQNHRYRLGAGRCSKSNTQANLRVATYDDCNRLESCSKDPIGFADGANPYSYVGNTPFIANDPDGLVKVLFDFVAKSFINGVNPVGQIVPDRPGIVPTPGIGITPINQPTATQRLRAFARIIQHLTAFNENPRTAAKDGKYRLYTRVDMTLDCTCDDIPFIDRMATDMDGGVESEWWMSWPFFPAPKVKGTINLVPLNVSYSFPSVLTVDWRGWGRPNALAEPGMQAVALRTSKNIWHWPEAKFICVFGEPILFSTDLLGSKFPSHRLWVNNRLADSVPQNTLADLWYPMAGAPSFVH